MKRLLLIWIFSGSLDSFCQDKPEKLYLWPDGTLSVLNPGKPLPPITDTIRSVLLVTGKPPAFTHAVYGYCIKRNGACVGHLDSRGRLFKLPVRVWGCESNLKIKTRGR
jgi:hypothetical protein